MPGGLTPAGTRAVGLRVGLRLPPAGDSASDPEKVRGCVNTTASGFVISGVVLGSGLRLWEDDLGDNEVDEREADDSDTGSGCFGVGDSDMTTFCVGEETGGTIEGEETCKEDLTVFAVGDTTCVVDVTVSCGGNIRGARGVAVSTFLVGDAIVCCVVTCCVGCETDLGG